MCLIVLTPGLNRVTPLPTVSNPLSVWRSSTALPLIVGLNPTALLCSLLKVRPFTAAQLSTPLGGRPLPLACHVMAPHVASSDVIPSRVVPFQERYGAILDFWCDTPSDSSDTPGCSDVIGVTWRGLPVGSPSHPSLPRRPPLSHVLPCELVGGEKETVEGGRRGRGEAGDDQGGGGRGCVGG